MLHFSTKKYDHSLGLSCCFRQHRAKSHCNKMHGYPLAFEFTFEAEELDENNWVVDFGSLKPIKEWLVYMFDHTFIVAQDDPQLALFRYLDTLKLLDIRIIPAVGCEKVAEFVHHYVSRWIEDKYQGRVRLFKTQVWEHGGNSAGFSSS